MHIRGNARGHEWNAQLDSNSDGLLQWEDFHAAMKPVFHHPFVPQALCRAFDTEGNGFVDFAQFARGMSVMTRGRLDERLTRRPPLPPGTSLDSPQITFLFLDQ